MAERECVRLFDVDPDLAAALPPEFRSWARSHVSVPVRQVAAGPWQAERDDPPPWGRLIVSGMVARETTVAGSAAVELFGTGDVLFAGGLNAAELLVPARTSWTALESTRLVDLDARFTSIVQRWPQLAMTLMQRVERRGERLAVAQAIGNLTRVDSRVLVMLWVLCERWGRVTTSGVMLPLRVTHRMLARLVGARRPTVTTAVQALARQQLLERRPDGTWLLRGEPPEKELKAVGADALRPVEAPREPLERPLAAVGEEARRMTERVGEMVASYERQARRLAELEERSRAVRDESRRLRLEAQRRVHPAPRPDDVPV